MFWLVEKFDVLTNGVTEIDEVTGTFAVGLLFVIKSLNNCKTTTLVAFEANITPKCDNFSFI
jgi:hypothetical protein